MYSQINLIKRDYRNGSLKASGRHGFRDAETFAHCAGLPKRHGELKKFVGPWKEDAHLPWALAVISLVLWPPWNPHKALLMSSAQPQLEESGGTLHLLQSQVEAAGSINECSGLVSSPEVKASRKGVGINTSVMRFFFN